MTHDDYELIASTIRDISISELDAAEGYDRVMIAEAFAKALQRSFNNFNKAAFLAACTVRPSNAH